MANSVLDALDNSDEINEIKLLISGYRSLGKFSVLVEGIDDVIVYEKFFVRDKVEVCQTNGCAKLVELVEGLDKKHLENDFIGIKDSDFDVLNHVTYPFQNLFLTDKHDLETMMISEESLENIMKIYLRYEDMKKDGKKIQSHKILSDAFLLLRPISFIRWFNDKNGINLKFGTLRLSTMMKVDATLGIPCCLKFLKRLNADATELTEEAIQNFILEASDDIDDRMLVRGHDLCDMISLLIKGHPYCCQGKKVSAEKIESSLKLTYGIDDFRKTQLYAEITDWFRIHGYQGMLTS